MRHAMTNRIFQEPTPGKVAHTAASRVLAEDAQMRDWVGMVTEDIMPVSSPIYVDILRAGLILEEF